MVESRIEAIRAAKRGEGQSLTQRQALALAGEWYVWYVARHEENPGPVEHWRSMWDALIFHLEEHAPDWVIEEGWRDLEWTREPEVRSGVRPRMNARRRSFSRPRASFSTPRLKPHFLIACWMSFLPRSCCSPDAPIRITGPTRVRQSFRSSMGGRLRDRQARPARGNCSTLG